MKFHWYDVKRSTYLVDTFWACKSSRVYSPIWNLIISHTRAAGPAHSHYDKQLLTYQAISLMVDVGAGYNSQMNDDGLVLVRNG